MGFAETYSTFTRFPKPILARPYCSGFCKIALRTFSHTLGARRKFKNPGPATSANATRVSANKRLANFSAISRGFKPEVFASTIAAFVAMSP